MFLLKDFGEPLTGWPEPNEYIYLHEFNDGKTLFEGLLEFIQFYNFERKHQSLLYLTPNQVFNERLPITKNSTKLNKM
ncbi:IS3 family transposase [Runella sp. CRIBMP]|uniref:IS3 family transposase n=1 Tax=Runella sp. CRIBMP TaxID=2683261 RepID=UPI0038F66EA6